ncbi:MAG TPA: hypothetical protein VMI54_23845 [Polyangiaceae bacterium]|nr:hypothetical protein [Polyangiaceae bacterium]
MTPLAPQAAFVEGNGFLHASLGALGLARRFRGTLEATVPAQGGASEVAAAPRAVSNETALHVVLGLLSLSLTVERAAATFGTSARLPTDGDGDDACERLSDLLR